MSGTTISGASVPFYGQYPAGANPSADSTAPATSQTTPGDIVDIRSRLGGTFTAAAGDAFSVSGLFTGTAAAGGSIVGYKVALGDSSGTNGKLLLNGKDVTGQTNFSADDFSHLQFVAGASGSTQSLVVVAQSGKKLADGNLVNEVDSPAVQLTANVTGQRSINAIPSLLTQSTGTDAEEISITQQASIFTGFGATPPSVSSVGNVTAVAGDTFSVSGLFTATAPLGGAIAGYEVALGDSSGNNGRLLLNGKDVTGQKSFTADQFSQLQYVAGASGSTQGITVVAQSGKKLADGNLVNEVDSPAVQINTSVTGSRSINGIPSLLTQSTGTDADTIHVVQQAAIFTGFGAPQPSVSTVGDFTAAAGDKFSVSGLFTGTAPSGGSIAGYQVVLADNSGANGQLFLNGKDVTGQKSFSADDFAHLQFVAGASGSTAGITVVAQSGKKLADGNLVNEIDSPPVQITAAVTGTRSINAAPSLTTQSTGTDAETISIAQQAAIFTGFGAAPPTLSTVGNFTGAAGDAFSVSALFTGTAPAGGSIASYQVALGDSSGGNGKLLLNGKDVTAQKTFSADDFSHLQYVAGANGSAESIVVVAQSGKKLADGNLVNEIDSPAVQITASATGTRSLNAQSALLTAPAGGDAEQISITQGAGIFTGFGAARPGLSTSGNFTAAPSDAFSVSGLFTATAPSGGSIASYEVALGDSSGANGKLLLNGKDVTGQKTFSADDFSHLQYVAGAAGSAQNIEVVAQSGKKLADGNLVNEVDSPAVQISASVTGARSLNAIPALLTQSTGNDASLISITQSASIFTGFGAARPSLSAIGDLSQPASGIAALPGLLGAYQSTSTDSGATAALPTAFAGAIGRTQTGTASGFQVQVENLATWALAATELGGFQSAGSTSSLQKYAIAAYQSGSAAG